MDNIRKKATDNFIWRFAERCGAQGISFIVSIILARLLPTEAYGTISIVTVFITILQVFVDSGMGNALILKKDADDLDFSSVFYFNIFLCLIFYILTFFVAPYIAEFYKQDELSSVIRVLGIILLISGVKNVQQAYVSKHLLFKRFFFSTLGGTIVAALVGIVMAYHGMGVWALVAQYLVNSAVDTTVLWITVKWRPKLEFSLERLKALYKHGWKLLTSSLINTVYSNLRQLIIGKVYSANDLAFFNRGKQFPELLITNVNSSIDSVLLPVIASEQDDKKRVKTMTRRSISLSSYIIWPLMVGLAVCAHPLVRILLSEKWEFCVPYLQIFCFIYVLWPIYTANLNAIKAVGRSDIFLKLEIIKKIIDVTVLIITVPLGVKAIALGMLLTGPVSVLINAGPNKKLINYSYYELLQDIFPAMLLSIVMGVIVYSIQGLGFNDLITLIIQVPLGIVIYIILSKILHIDNFEYIIGIIKGIKKNNK